MANQSQDAAELEGSRGDTLPVNVPGRWPLCSLKVTRSLGFKDAIRGMATMHHVCLKSSWQDIKSSI